MLYTIIGYITLPFYGLYCWIKESLKGKSDNYKVLFFLLLTIIGMLVYDLIKSL